MEYLFSRPNPARMPNQIQSFWLPVFTMRMNNRATHPEQRLEDIHGQQVVAGEDTWRDEYGEGGKPLGKSVAAKFTGQSGS